MQAMPPDATLATDVVIFGGGAAGLWTLDDLRRRGYDALLLEARDLGEGQTIASQGIIHGGLKYSLGGLLSASARAIRDMPVRWRRSLAGEQPPDLRRTRRRAEYCHLWRMSGVGGRLSMLGARIGLRVAPVPLADDERPAILRECPGDLARLDEQVIEPASFLEDLAERHRDALLRIDAGGGLELEVDGPGEVRRIVVTDAQRTATLAIEPAAVVLTAGAGNDALRRAAGIDGAAAQRRPLHMVLMRGRTLPPLNGHCVDGTATRVTITSTRDLEDRVVWQVGGMVAESGIDRTPREQIDHAREEVSRAVPALDSESVQWSTYEAVRAEGRGPGGRRPDHPVIERHGRTLTAWPTKLALVPRLADELAAVLPPPRDAASATASDVVRAWPRPVVALPPWERSQQWIDG